MPDATIFTIKLPNILLRISHVTIGVIACTFAFNACVKSVRVEKKDPFVVSKKEIRETVRIIGLADVKLPDGLEKPAPIAAQFDSLVASALKQTGFSIVRPQGYEAVWTRTISEMGGLDDASGERDPEQFVSAMFRTISALKPGFELDAVLIPSVEVVEARFAGGRAKWDGTTQSIEARKTPSSFFRGAPDGRVGALSLRIKIVGRNNRVLYDFAGGIELLSKLSGERFILVPRNELFNRPEYIRHAVSTALKPLHR